MKNYLTNLSFEEFDILQNNFLVNYESIYCLSKSLLYNTSWYFFYFYNQNYNQNIRISDWVLHVYGIYLDLLFRHGFEFRSQQHVGFSNNLP